MAKQIITFYETHGGSRIGELKWTGAIALESEKHADLLA
jgi:hypothetical protein